MTTQATANVQTKSDMRANDWIKLGLTAAVVSVVAVLAVQTLSIAVWPEIVLFKPLDSYIRSVIFTLAPVIGATILFAWLVARQAQPVQSFINISVV